MTVTLHPLADQYLRRLERAARALPRGQREELLAEIRSHLELGLAPDASEAEARNLLDDLGSPADIVAAARPEHVPARRGAREVFALIFLVTGFPWVLGWLIGVGLLVSSPLWSAREKLLGMFVWPGGYAAVALVVPFVAFVWPSAWAYAVMILLVVAPLVVAAYLYQAAGRQADAA